MLILVKYSLKSLTLRVFFSRTFDIIGTLEGQK